MYSLPKIPPWRDQGIEDKNSIIYHAIFLISSKDREEAFKKAVDLCFKNKIDKIDIDSINFEKSAGIEDVRIIQKKFI